MTNVFAILLALFGYLFCHYTIGKFQLMVKYRRYKFGAIWLTLCIIFTFLIFYAIYLLVM